MKGHGSQFGRRKEAAIAALLSTRTIDDAARETGISGRTMLRWMKDPEFQEEYLLARRQSQSQATARLQSAAGAAAALLTKALVDPNVPHTAIRAAHSILEMGRKGIETEDLAIRVAKVERNEKMRN
jgi:hypothetical protein